ncbi:unnamed protein product [Cuscuta campestris]|uniref:RNase III domain-containing protein n=2 Tax=Cuscuta sect. Cleistogrammica TaxID=1824901 RepID=A0A484K3A2_9ASTE|nr:hypothetical protein DM860_015611 [Cuscuta australis]VFQ60143.1 unnamed protein product [Cuscuta campestris]
MEASINAVEHLLQYRFKDKRLLEEALTHPSYADSPSYQRLEFLGDMALGMVVSNFIFLTYPRLDPGQLSLLRSANISTEKLARVAVDNGLFRHFRHSSSAIDEKVTEFVMTVREEDEAQFYGGAIKAPKVLADIVESIAGAVYVDSRFNLENLWLVFRGLLEPIITLDVLQNQPQPVTMLFEYCQKIGKKVDIKHRKNKETNIASIYIDGNHLVSSSSEQKENARLHAAKAALKKLAYEVVDTCSFEFDDKGNEGAKRKLHELCAKKKWTKPVYSLEREIGPSHKKKFVCSVEIGSTDATFFRVGGKRSHVLSALGEKKSRIRDAENSAAYAMLCSLKDENAI